MKRMEDYRVIDKKNRITNHKAYTEKDSPYPVMYVDKSPVWEGDKVLFVNNVGMIQVREIKWQHRAILNKNPDWANSFFFDIRKIDYNKALTVADIEELAAKIY